MSNRRDFLQRSGIGAIGLLATQGCSDHNRAAPDFRIINLETSITTSEDWAPKDIHYRMHPANIPCLTVAKVDCCVLANNHVLDWGRSGLVETLETL